MTAQSVATDASSSSSPPYTGTGGKQPVLGMNGNASGVGSSIGGGGASGSGPVSGARQQRVHHFNPHQTPTFHPQQNYGVNHQYGSNANHHHGFTPQQQQHSYGGNAGGGGGGNFVPSGAVGPTPNGYGGYEFVPAQQQAGWRHQYGAGGGYGQMGHGGGLGAGGYYYPSGNAGPMMGMGMNMGMGPGGAGMNGVVAPGYGGMGMGMGGGVVPGMMMGPAMQPPTGINHNGPAPGVVGMGMGMGMGGMQNGAAGMSRFPPAFTPQSQVHAAPQQQLGSLGPGLVGHVNGVNGSGAAGGNGQASSSPYPAYHHASSAATSSSVTSPSLSNTTVNTATTPATTATTTVTVGSASGSVSSPPPNDAASTPTPGSGARSMSSYLPSGMEQNPYAHLHQQHASHPHHNPYANMQPGAGPASNIPLGMSPAAYGNGGLYQPYGPPHQQQPMQNGPPGGPLSPAHMHAPIHSLSVTPKMNHRTSYGYPVLPTTNSTAASGPLRKPSVVISAHDSGISVLGSQSGRRPSISESSLLNVDGAVVEDDESGSEVNDEQASDGEPVFASINQAVAKKAKKSKRKQQPQPQPQPQPQQTEDVKSPSVRLEETVVAEPKQVEEAKETNVLGPAVSLDTEATPPITDTFTDELESFHNDDPSGSRPKRSQWISAGRPHPIETAPGVVFNQSTAIPARLYPIINTWDQIERKGKSGKAKGKMRSQTNAVSLQKRRRAGKGLEVEFGEVSQSVLAEVMRAKEEASALQQNMATDTQQEVSNNPPQPSKPTEEVVLKVTDDAIKAEQTTESEAPTAVGPISVDSITPVPTPASVPATSPSPAQASPVAKATPKSWAALLRGPTPKSTPATSAPASVPSSNVTSPTLAQSAVMEQVPGSNEHQSPKKVIVVDGVMTPGGATTPVAPAKPANAWGARPMIVPDQLDLGRLLAEGLDERTRASLKKVTSVPRGLINTGNMCFANSILQVLAYCVPFASLLEELGRRSIADLGRRTPLTEALIVFLREFAATDPPNPAPSTTASSSASSSNGAAINQPSAMEKQRAHSGQSIREPFVPAFVYEAMKENKRFDSMRRGHQEDAEEFFGFLLETVHEEFLYMQSRYESRNTGGGYGRVPAKVDGSTAETSSDEREVSRPVSPGAAGGDGWLEVGKKQKVNVVRTTESKDSAVSRLFGGKLRSVLHTPGQKDSITLEPYQPLQLDISTPHVYTITDALLHLHEPEVIPGVWSASKGVNVDATKQVFVENVPPILILHLKRFLYDAEQQRVVKKSKPVAYASELTIPNEILSPARRVQGKSLRYKLFGVVYHHGTSATGGHYTAAVLRQDSSGWLHLDDESVEQVAEEQVVVGRDAAERGSGGEIGRAKREKCAYLLFYQRID